jgi:exopolysaccharide production protein ExoQ
MRRRPLGAIVSQLIVAASSLLLSFIALRELGASGLGAFSLLLGILTTFNSIQTGWIGDSLTVMDRFDPGIRRALFHSQWAAIGLVTVATFVLGLQVDGIDSTTAVLFAVAAVTWAVEETLRRILIARREFWGLVANDSAFAVGSLGLLLVVAFTGAGFTIDTMMVSLIAGAIVAIGLGVMQLPRVELVPGPREPSRMRELASFAGWRAFQVGLRPATMTAMRAIVAATASLTVLGQLEAARLVIAPVLTIVNGAGVYLLPTYAGQARRRVGFRPSVARAMWVVGGLAAAYGVAAVLLRRLLVQLLTNGTTPVTAGALVSWALFSMAFGVGVPPGSATVALGRSRQTFMIRAIDAALGLVAVSVLSVIGWFDAVPAGLAFGAFVGAALLVEDLRKQHVDDDLAGIAEPPGAALADNDTAALDDLDGFVFVTVPPPPPPPAHWRWSGDGVAPVAPPSAVPPRAPRAPRPVTPAIRRSTRPSRSRGRSRTIDWHVELLWIVPLLLIVATEYKIRRRNIEDLLTNSIDPAIAVELAVYAVVGVWALWRLIPSKPRLAPLTMVMWGYVLTTAASALYSNYPLLALARAVQLVIIATVVQLVASEGRLQTIGRFLHGWIVLLSVSIVIGLLYVFPTTGPQEGRFTWLSVHSVSAGSMLALSVPVLFGLWLTTSRRRMPWPRWVYGSLFVVHLVFLMLTRTRGSIGGALVAVAVMAWLSSGRRVRPELVLGSLVIGGAMALAFGRQVLDFMTRGESVDQIGTFNRRTEIWSLAWRAFLEHPVFGLGFNSAKGVFFDATGLGGAHNAAINVMIDAGLVGLIWWVSLIVMAIAALSRLRRIDRRSPVLLSGAAGTARADILILIGLFTAMLINSITTEGLGAGVNVSAIWLFLITAWLTILDRTQHAERARRVERSARSVRQFELAGEVRNREFESLP